MASFLPYVLAFALAVGTASAIECYSCNSEKSGACKYSFVSFTYDTESCSGTGIGVLDSSALGPKCYKITAKNKEGQEYIARGCMPPPAIGCHALATTVGWLSDKTSDDPRAISDIDCETCDTDKCNSASKLAGFTFFGVLLATLAFLF